jgi:hypothetical protein
MQDEKAGIEKAGINRGQRTTVSDIRVHYALARIILFTKTGKQSKKGGVNFNQCIYVVK